MEVPGPPAAGEADAREEVRRLGEDEQRLRRWLATLKAQGDSLGVRPEVERQLAAVTARREALGRARPSERFGSQGLRFMARGDGR
jgi:hypothetical protein